MKNATDFFLGCPTSGGFVSLFDRLTEEHSPYKTYIIKGGPGCGKSTLMRLTAKKLSERGYPVELIHCASDPDSLDGVICRNRRIAVVDGTSPHVVVFKSTKINLPARLQNKGGNVRPKRKISNKSKC